MLQIIKVNPDDNKLIYFLYEFLKSSCENYKELSFSDFNKCRNSIFIVIDLSNKLNNIIALIGCHRVTMDDIGVETLSYYCQPNYLMYEISFLHFDDSYTTYNRQEYAKSIITQLIKECIADKNDGFISYKLHCPNNAKYEFHDILINIGFEQVNFKDTIQYIKKPTTM